MALEPFSSWLPSLASEALWHVDVPVLGLFARWDSAFYMYIVRHGYSQPELWAFRPLYPLVLAILGAPFRSFLSWDQASVWSGFLAGLLFFLGGTFMFYRLSSLVLGGSKAAWATSLLSFAPGGVFWTAIYPEALYLLLVASGLYWLEVWKPFRCALTILLAGMTRPEGVLLAVVFFAKVVTGHAHRRSLLMLAGAVIGGQVLLAVYAGVVGGDAVLPWQAEIAWPKETLATALLNPPSWQLFFSVYIISAYIWILAIGYGLLTRSERTSKRLPYYIWMTVLALVAFVIPDYRSIPRLMLGALPLFWILGAKATQNARFGYLTLLVFMELAAGGTLLFVNWYPFH